MTNYMKIHLNTGNKPRDVIFYSLSEWPHNCFKPSYPSKGFI